MKTKIPPPLWLIIYMALAKGLALLVPAAVFLKGGWSGVAYGLVAAGFLFALPAMRSFFAAKTTISPHHAHKSSTLVTTGVYKITRNPMYLGLFLVLTGWTIGLANLISLITLPLFVATLTYLQIKPEEEALEAIFGDDYRSYKNRVRRWL